MKVNCHVPRGGWGLVLRLTALISVVGMVALRAVSPIGPAGANQPSIAESLGQQNSGVQPSANPHKAGAVFASVPLSFEPNQGQTHGRVKFLARGQGYTLFLTGTEAVLKLQASGVKSRESAGRASVVRMRLAGAKSSPSVTGADRMASVSNYLIGNNPSKWQSSVPHFARVRYEQVYPGVDLVYYGKQGQLEYDFEVRPGADPRVVQLQFDPAQKLSVGRRGDLVVRTNSGDLRFQAPDVYQQTAEGRRSVAGRFVLRAGNRVSFQIGDYDRSRTLVIDPVLSYSSYLGGSGNESGATVAVDAALNTYVSGATTSTDFPTTAGARQRTNAGVQNVFVSKFDSNNVLVFSTYLGGNGTDSSVGIAVDSSFDVFVAGNTTSTNFPTSTSTAFQAGPPPSGNHVFVSRLSPDGASLPYSTYLFGSGIDTASGVAADNAGNAFVTGTTTSASVTAGFPATAGAFQTTLLGTTQFFVSKVNTNASGAASMAYSTYFGGGNPLNGTATGGGIALDNSGNVYFTGATNFLNISGGAANFPILNAAHACLNDPSNSTTCPSLSFTDAFVAKIRPNTSGAQLLYSTYIGGTADDAGTGIAVDAGGNAYITGSTSSTDWPFTTGAAQTANAGGQDAIVAKLNNPASGAVSVTYSSYLGGSQNDVGNAIAVDSTQGARIVGTTLSPSFPAPLTVANFGPTGGGDAFVARIDTTGSGNGQYAALLGGTGPDHGTGVAVDSNGVTNVAGDTASGNFPVVTPFQAGPSGLSDAFVAKVGPTLNLTMTVAPSANPTGIGNPVTFTYTITNASTDTTGGIFFNDTLPAAGATFGSINASPGTCAAPASGQVLCSIGTLTAGGKATVSVVMTPTTPGTLSNSAQALVSGSSFSVANGTSVPVTDFAVAVTPSTQTVQAGNSASYQVQVSPVPTFGNSIALTSSGLPAGAGFTFSTTPVTIANNSPASSTLTITTTARPVTTSLWPGSRVWYAAFLPVSGLAFLGLGVGTRRKRLMTALLLCVGLGGVFFMVACGSSNKATPTVNQGTPAGTYTITVTGTSGSASHGATTVLVVQ